MSKEVFDQIAEGLKEAVIIAPYLDKIERLEEALKLAVFTDSEYVKLLEEENDRFREALRKIADNEVVGYPTVDGIRDFAYVVLEGK